MSFHKLILQSIKYYRKLNLMIVFGIAISTAILTGALVVGDSVQFALQQIVQQRLGKSSWVITAGERLFRRELAAGINSQSGAVTTAMLRTNGFAVIDGGTSRVNQLSVWGVDSTLGYFGNNSDAFSLQGNQAAINENLAQLTGLKVGDEFLLTLNKLNTFPANTPFVSVKENNIAFYVRIERILTSKELGNLNLQNIQSAPRNLFLNINALNKQMGLQNKANVILLDEKFTGDNLMNLIQQNWQTDDLNLQIRENNILNYTELISDRVFIEPILERFCSKTLPESKPVFSYFVNSFRANGFETPYSFVSSDPNLSGQQIIVSQWMADDLKLKRGDTVSVSYFQIGLMRKLVEKDTLFIVDSIYSQEGARGDKNLMPTIPGLSDAGNCRDWKSGVPVNLKKIRPKDEEYWKQYSGTPKAFISLETAQKLWGNRFGKTTSIRISGLNKAALEKAVLSGVHPSEVGFEMKDARLEGKNAAVNGVDFGQLFIGLSFFVLFAAVLLSFILFRLFLNFRRSEIGTLSALGFSIPKIRSVFLTEAFVYVFLGILIGIPFGIFYNYLILKAINTIWVDIVRTSVVVIHVRAITIMTGCFVIVIISMMTIWIILKNYLKSQLIHLQRKTISTREKSGIMSAFIGSMILLISFSLLLFKGFNNGEISSEYFFISGFGLLPGLILMVDFLMCRLGTRGENSRYTFRKFSLNRFVAERRRNIMIISFLSVGVFLVVSTGLNRKDLTINSEMNSSGTGGYSYFIETSIPLLTNPDSPMGRDELDLSQEVEIVPFQVRHGDDASCLNLNRVIRPEIIACNTASFDRRSSFTFLSFSSETDQNHPWLSLDETLEDGLIPAFADQTVIQWGLGKSVGDTLVYTNEEGKSLKLKLIGSLANSVFQGKVILSENHFAKAFPSVSGSSMFLIDTPESTLSIDELRKNWHTYGPEISKTSDRLLSFYQVENTYLNIFLMLGALALLIGTLGLGILIFRITFEQIPEYSLLLILGYHKSQIIKMVIRERFVLITIAVVTGIVPAVFCAIPTLTSSLYSNLWIWLPSIAILVLLSGILSSYIAIRIAFKQNLIDALRNE